MLWITFNNPCIYSRDLYFILSVTYLEIRSFIFTDKISEVAESVGMIYLTSISSLTFNL